MMMKHNLIGTTEYIYLPEVTDDPLPAKIDTGADGSAIWASSIEEKDGKLSYVLFSPQSAFYTGTVFTTDDYRVVSVKNSFGHKEYRYRIKLRMKIARKSYRTLFTLADRSRSRFPILLGKRFLKDRYLVDVARHNIMHDASGEEVSGKVVVLTSRVDQPTKDFFATVAELGALNVETAKYRLLDYRINGEGEARILLPDGSDLASAQTVYFKAHTLYPEHAGAAARYLQYRHVNFIDKNVAHFVSRSKLSEYFILATSGIPVPAMKVYSSGLDGVTYDEIVSYFDEPKFVLKDAFGDRGKDNYLIVDKITFDDAAARLEGKKTIIAQKFIDSVGFTRVLVMGDEVVHVVERSQSSHSDPLKNHLNKPHGSSNARELKSSEYSADVIALARKAALALDRTIAGVDLIQDKVTKKWYVLEANYNPEITSGVNIAKKAKAVAKLLAKEGQNK
jgi:glutathione synthase/RimK-type ligase-like ATP-grasp enzyme